MLGCFLSLVSLSSLEYAYPRVKRCFIRVGSGLTCKHQTRLECAARNKHSSVLRIFVNYGHKMFNNIGPRSQCFKIVFLCPCRCGRISWSVFSRQVFQDRLIFEGQGRSLLKEWGSVSASVLHINVKLFRYKHSSLFIQNVGDKEKKFL